MFSYDIVMKDIVRMKLVILCLMVHLLVILKKLRNIGNLLKFSLILIQSLPTLLYV